MKKTIGTLIILIAVSQSAHAQTVVSYMGATAIQTPAEGFSLKGFPFLGTNTVSVQELFGDTMPIGTKIYLFADGTYSSIETYDVVIGGNPITGITYSTNWTPNTAVIDGSAGFWIRLPEGSDAVTNLFNGNVVEQDNIPITIKPGFNLIAIPYSSSVVWTNSQLAKSASFGDKVYAWDSQEQGYSVINQYKEQIAGNPIIGITYFTNWTDTAMEIDLAEGFWYESKSITTNVIPERIPYDLKSNL